MAWDDQPQSAICALSCVAKYQLMGSQSFRVASNSSTYWIYQLGYTVSIYQFPVVLWGLRKDEIKNIVLFFCKKKQFFCETRITVGTEEGVQGSISVETLRLETLSTLTRTYWTPSGSFHNSAMLWVGSPTENFNWWTTICLITLH